MENKENGNFRPTYFCLKDEKTSLLWVVPMSSRVEKYQPLYDRQVEKYGKCITIVMGEFDGKKAAFLLQNMFPITENYLDHIHTKNGNPVPVNTTIQKIIHQDMQQIRQLIKRNCKIVFPDVRNIERIMIHELQSQEVQESKEDFKPILEKEKTPYNDILVKLRSTKESPERPKPKAHEPER